VVGAADLGGLMPLHCAAMEGRAEAATLLLMRGASATAADKRGRTAVDVGCNKTLRQILSEPRPPEHPPPPATQLLHLDHAPIATRRGIYRQSTVTSTVGPKRRDMRLKEGTKPQVHTLFHQNSVVESAVRAPRLAEHEADAMVQLGHDAVEAERSKRQWEDDLTAAIQLQREEQMLEGLLALALLRGRTDVEGANGIRQSIAEGKRSRQHYVDLWEQRLQRSDVRGLVVDVEAGLRSQQEAATAARRAEMLAATLPQGRHYDDGQHEAGAVFSAFSTSGADSHGP
jgi:hypothetical protein